MLTKNQPNSKQTITAWDLYCENEFKRLVHNFSENDTPDIKDLVHLAQLEIKTNVKNVKEADPNSSLFIILREGMTAYHKHEFKKSSQLLGDWLLKKDYFSNSILLRFCESAINSRQWHLIQNISHKYFAKKNYQKQLTPALILSLYHTAQHKEVIQIYEKSFKNLSENDNKNILPKIALSYIHTGEFQTAEELLLPFYIRLNGKSYKSEFEKYKKIYQTNSSKNNNTPNNLKRGLGHLFNGNHEKALEIFLDIS